MSEYDNYASCIWVVIPTFNRCETLRACLQELLAQSYSNVKIVVVNDASQDGTAQMLGGLSPNIVTLMGDGNRWWSGAMNLGLGWVIAHAAAGDFVLSFNDDVLVDNDYLAALVRAARSAPQGSLIGSMAVDSEDVSKIVYCGTRIDWSRGLWKGLSASDIPNNEDLIPTDSLPGRGALIPVEVVRRIGFYNERSFPQYFGDEDFALRAFSTGSKLFVARQAVVRSHVQLTGTGRHSQTFASFYKSLWSIRSPNQLSRRVIFIWQNCPRPFRLQFVIIDIIKVTTAYWRRRDLRI